MTGRVVAVSRSPGPTMSERNESSIRLRAGLGVAGDRRRAGATTSPVLPGGVQAVAASSIVSPEDQRVTFVELFFDLVFVFSVTQVVSLFHGHLTWAIAARALLAFWLVWWAWTQFTWALNAADTTHHRVAMATLLATAVAFVMAVALPRAFDGEAHWFAVPYVLVRLIGLVLYTRVAAADAEQRNAVRLFFTVSLGGLAAVLLGAFSGQSLYLFWGLAIVLDVVAAAVGGQAEGWNLHAEHFGERHGLFVIIALGETLIVAATGVSRSEWTASMISGGLLTVAATCALWWSYFMRAKPVLDRALDRARGSARSTMARDVFSLIHFPMICGIIAYAAGVEEAAAHPGDVVSPAGRVALAAGVVLFVGGMAAAMWRADRRVLGARAALSLAAAGAVLFTPGLLPQFALGIVLVAVAAVAVLESRALPPAGEAP